MFMGMIFYRCAAVLLLLNISLISFSQSIKCIGPASDNQLPCSTKEIYFNQQIYFELSDLPADFDKAENIILYINGLPLPYYTSSGINTTQKRVFFKLGLRGNDANNTQKNIVDLIRKDFENYNNKIGLRFGLGSKSGKPISYDSIVYLTFFSQLKANVIAAIAVILFFLIFYALIKWEVLKDDDQKSISLRKFQLAFWTFLIILSYVSLWLILKETPILPVSILGLFSIALGTTIVSSFIPLSKKNNLTGLKGLFVDNGDQISITKIQHIAFTLFFGIIFLYAAFFEFRIYDFSQQQLLLMGLSSGGYLGLKTYYATKDGKSHRS